MLFEGMFCKISSDQNNNGRSLCNRILNWAVYWFSGTEIDKYGEEVLRELEEEKQNKKEKEAAVSCEIQNVNQTVAFFMYF